MKQLETNFREEIRKIAENSLYATISLSHFCKNNNELFMVHDIAHDRLYFRYTDNSKPFLYKEYAGNGKIADKVFKDKYRGIGWKYPYLERIIPAKMEATRWSLFNVFEYRFSKEKKERIPDYNQVESFIYLALESFEIIEQSE